jgi:acetyl esterase/lipase
MLRRLALLGAALLLASCTSLKLAVANAPALLGDYQRHAALGYGTGPRRTLDIYVPRGARAAPVVVFWYGGSFEYGRRENYRFVGAALAQRGLVAVLPDYRVYPPALFPEFVDDAAQAVKWVHDHAAAYGGDPARLFLMGHSAGGYLASMVALDRRYLSKAGAGDVRVRGLIALSAPHVLVPNTRVLKVIFGPPWTTADWQPLNFSSSSAPPALLIHGQQDQTVDPRNSETLAATLRARGVDVTLRIIPRLNHSDTIAAFSVPLRRRAPVLDETVAFIQRWSAN